MIYNPGASPANVEPTLPRPVRVHVDLLKTPRLGFVSIAERPAVLGHFVPEDVAWWWLRSFEPVEESETVVEREMTTNDGTPA